jgi:hypothetical protein
MALERDSGPVIEDQRLPSDRRAGISSMRLLAQIFPGVAWFSRFLASRLDALTEESLAVIAAASTVHSEMDRLTAFSGAHGEDLQACHDYYTHLQEMGHARLHMLTESYHGSSDVMLERMVSRLVVDARLDIIEELERSGELPEEIAMKLRDRFEEEHTAKVKVV